MQQHGSSQPTSAPSWATKGSLLFIAACVIGTTLLLIAIQPALSDRIALSVGQQWQEITGTDLNARLESLRADAKSRIPSRVDVQHAGARSRAFLTDGTNGPLAAGAIGGAVLLLITAGIVLNRRPAPISLPYFPEPGIPAPAREQARPQKTEPQKRVSRYPFITSTRQADIERKLERVRTMNEPRRLFTKPDEIVIPRFSPPDVPHRHEPAEQSGRPPALQPIRTDRRQS